MYDGAPEVLILKSSDHWLKTVFQTVAEAGCTAREMVHAQDIISYVTHQSAVAMVVDAAATMALAGLRGAQIDGLEELPCIAFDEKKAIIQEPDSSMSHSCIRINGSGDLLGLLVFLRDHFETRHELNRLRQRVLSPQQAGQERENRTVRTNIDSLLPIMAGMTLAKAEQILIENTIEYTGGNKKRAATILGISEKSIYNKLAQYRVQDSSKRGVRG